MDESKFLAELEELLELNPGSLKLGDPLNTKAEWDSLAVLSFLAMADSKYGVTVSAAELVNCREVGDLCRLVMKK